MLINTNPWPKPGYLEPNPGHLIPVTVRRREKGLESGWYLGTATVSGHRVSVIAPVKGYCSIWKREN